VALISVYVCPFCRHRLPPQPLAGRPYENLDSYAYEVSRCTCGAVAVCSVDDVEGWNAGAVGKNLCTSVLGLSPERCEIIRNSTDSSPAFEVVWAKKAA
jgi:hypothetical protein